MFEHGFNIMAFPAGPLCNLNCTYCYYVDQTALYDSSKIFMDEVLLEEYVRTFIEAHPGPHIDFGWQGGEPTLRGLDFYKKAVELQKKYLPTGWECRNNFQTNGVLIDEEWVEFFSEHNFLLGISLDGPEHLHDITRIDKVKQGTHTKVVKAIEYLQRHNVDFNVLSVVNRQNASYPHDVYSYFQSLGIEFIQFIPLVESGGRVTNEHSLLPGEYGFFLISIFNQWLKDGFGTVFIQIFEEVFRIFAGMQASLCVFRETCGETMVMEHNGDFYSCDHFVSPEFKLGNIKDTPISTMAHSTRQREFGDMKRDSLSKRCLSCSVRFLCHGGCPKNRISETDNGEKINYLCADYKRFFTYVSPFAELIVQGLAQKKSLAMVQDDLLQLYEEQWNIGRNDFCPCGSKEKYKKCCLQKSVV